MWYEILPSMVIVGASIYIPGLLVPKYLHLWDRGNAFGRDALRADMRHYLKRDQSRHGDVYRFAGLETIKNKD